MTLREARVAFSRQVAKLILWAADHGLDLSLDEGRVLSRRKVRFDSQLAWADDAVHMKGSLHYEGLAQDLTLYIDGVWIADGGHPAWTRIGEQWEAQGKDSGLPLAWGGRFVSRDSNHVSHEWQGRK